jgi:hypothetical protein
VTLHNHPRKTGGLSVTSGLPRRGTPLQTAEFVPDFRKQMKNVDNFIKGHFDPLLEGKTLACWDKFFTKTFPESAIDAATYMEGKKLYVPLAEQLFGLEPTARDQPSVAGMYETQQQYLNSPFDIQPFIFEAETQDSVRHEGNKDEPEVGRILLTSQPGVISRELATSTKKTFNVGEMVRFVRPGERTQRGRGEIRCLSSVINPIKNNTWYVIWEQSTNMVYNEVHASNMDAIKAPNRKSVSIEAASEGGSPPKIKREEVGSTATEGTTEGIAASSKVKAAPRAKRGAAANTVKAAPKAEGGAAASKVKAASKAKRGVAASKVKAASKAKCEDDDYEPENSGQVQVVALSSRGALRSTKPNAFRIEYNNEVDDEGTAYGDACSVFDDDGTFDSDSEERKGSIETGGSAPKGKEGKVASRRNSQVRVDGGRISVVKSAVKSKKRSFASAEIVSKGGAAPKHSRETAASKGGCKANDERDEDDNLCGNCESMDITDGTSDPVSEEEEKAVSTGGQRDLRTMKPQVEVNNGRLSVAVFKTLNQQAEDRIVKETYARRGWQKRNRTTAEFDQGFTVEENRLFSPGFFAYWKAEKDNRFLLQNWRRLKKPPPQTCICYFARDEACSYCLTRDQACSYCLAHLSKAEY